MPLYGDTAARLAGGRAIFALAITEQAVVLIEEGLWE
jgi:hypothetical protein